MVYQVGISNAPAIVAAWRAELRAIVAEHVAEDFQDAGLDAAAPPLTKAALLAFAGRVDVHPAFLLATDIRLDIEGDDIRRPTSKPDFRSAQFSLVSEPFKTSTHGRWAVQRRDLALFADPAGPRGVFEPLPADDSVGFWRVAPAPPAPLALERLATAVEEQKKSPPASA